MADALDIAVRPAPPRGGNGCSGASGAPASIPHGELARIPLFGGVGEKQLAELLRASRFERHPSGTRLFSQGEAAHELHVVLGGTIELFADLGGQHCGILLVSAFDVLMPAAALFEQPYLNSATVLTPASVLAVEAAAARRCYRQCPAFAANLGRIMAGQFRMAVRHIVDLKTRGAAQRLGAFLLRLVDPACALPRRLPWPKKTLAARVGIKPETLSRCIQELAENGLLLRGSEIIVRDRARIDAFCSSIAWLDKDEAELSVNAH